MIYRVDRGVQSNIGVVYKLLGQVRGLEALGYHVDYVIHDKIGIYKSGKKIAKASDNLFFKWRYYDKISDEHLAGYDLYIYRYGLSTRSFIKCLRRTRSLNRASTICIDMPTYPYAYEWEGVKGRFAMLIDGYWSSHLRKYVNRIMHSGMESMIHGVATVRITNGVDLNRLHVRQINSDKGLRLLAIGKWRSWHGLDRLIKGMASAKRDGLSVHLDVIGEGDELPRLERIVSSMNIKDRVIFHRTLTGSELDSLFDQADLGVGTLGLHRKNVMFDSSLKHREYVARGLPFILAGRDVDIPAHLGFTIQMTPDDSDLDLSSISESYEKLDLYYLISKMRSYAEQHLSWTSKMKTLLDELS